MKSRDSIDTSASSFSLYAWFLQQYTGQTIAVIFALILSGFMESIGLLSLLPLLSLTFKGESTSNDNVPWIEEVIIDGIYSIGLEPEIGILLLIIFLTITLKAILHLSAMGYVGTVMANIATDLRLRIIYGAINAKWNYFVNQPLGYFGNAVVTEAGLSSSMYSAICQFLASFFHVLIFTGAALLVNFDIALWTVIVSVIMLVILNKFIGIARRAGEKAAVANKGLNRVLLDSLQGIKPLKSMGLEKFMVPLLEDEVSNLRVAQRNQVIAKYSLGDLREPVIVGFIAIGLYVFVVHAEIPMANLLVIAIIFHRSLTAVGQLQQNYQQIKVTETYFRSLWKRIRESNEARENITNGVTPVFEDEIEFRNVSFSYGENCVINSISFKIPFNKITAITGPSGVGKTTIIDLLIGLQDVDSGEILISGRALNEINIKQWREVIGYVPQELFLFHDTVLNNVTLGDSGISQKQAITALKQSGSWGFVSELENGIDTMLGERGVRLSGGQRQRIAIARALVRSPKLLILDEATTALDPETEREICDILLTLKDITIVAISHQRTIVEIAENVIRLENGSTKSAN